MLNSCKMLIISKLFLWRNPPVSEDDSLHETPKNIRHLILWNVKHKGLAASEKLACPLWLFVVEIKTIA